MVVAQVTTPIVIQSPETQLAESKFSEPKKFIPLEEYRSLAEASDERLEYHNGEIITMAGGSETHSAIASNLLIYLGFLLRDTSFRLYGSDLRIWIPEFQCGTYPDLMVVDSKPEFNGDRTDEIINPLLIVEVLSNSTEGYDRGDKFRKYRSIPSFREYLLVSQIEPYIEHYFKLEGDRWQLEIGDRLEGKITLCSLNNIDVPISEIYRRVDF